MKSVIKAVAIGFVVLVVLSLSCFTKESVEQEGFSSHINGFYRPYARSIRMSYEGFMNNYGPTRLTYLLRKWSVI